MATNKKITIEALVVMVQNGIVELREELDKKPSRDEVKTMIKEEIAVVKADINRVGDRVGRLGDKIDDDRAAQTTIKRQVEKHERWHYQTAEKVGIKLEN